MFRADWRHILDDACEENGNVRSGRSVFMIEGRGISSGGEGMADSSDSAPQHSGWRSQWRLRKIGTSEKAQNRWTLMRALEWLATNK
jgi:hypothetical protein